MAFSIGAGPVAPIAPRAPASQTSSPQTATPDAPAAQRDAALWQTATEFEAVFLAEMLQHAGLGSSAESAPGGLGEDMFTSLLTREYADGLAEAGGLGLAEPIYRVLARQTSTGETS